MTSTSTTTTRTTTTTSAFSTTITLAIFTATPATSSAHDIAAFIFRLSPSFSPPMLSFFSNVLNVQIARSVKALKCFLSRIEAGVRRRDGQSAAALRDTERTSEIEEASRQAGGQAGRRCGSRKGLSFSTERWCTEVGFTCLSTSYKLFICCEKTG